MKSKNLLYNKTGFTLIEVIVVLILAGILVALAGMGIVSVVKGFVFTKENTQAVQKGQIALMRIVKEFTVISSVDTNQTNGHQITYTSYKQNGSTATHRIKWDSVSKSVSLCDGNGANCDIVTDQVGSQSDFELGYYNDIGGTKYTTWSADRKVIEITLKITGADGIQSVFRDFVVPRNIS